MLAALMAVACGPQDIKEQTAQFSGVCGLLIEADADAPISELNKVLASHDAKFCRWSLGRREMLAFRSVGLTAHVGELETCKLADGEEANKVRLTRFKDLPDFSTACFGHGIQISDPENHPLKDRLSTMPKRCFSWARVKERSPLLGEPNPVWLVNQLYQDYTLPVFASDLDGDRLSFWLDVPRESATEALVQQMTAAAEAEGLVLTPVECNAP